MPPKSAFSRPSQNHPKLGLESKILQELLELLDAFLGRSSEALTLRIRGFLDSTRSCNLWPSDHRSCEQGYLGFTVGVWKFWLDLEPSGRECSRLWFLLLTAQELLIARVSSQAQAWWPGMDGEDALSDGIFGA